MVSNWKISDQTDEVVNKRKRSFLSVSHDVWICVIICINSSKLNISDRRRINLKRRSKKVFWAGLQKGGVGRVGRLLSEACPSSPPWSVENETAIGKLLIDQHPLIVSDLWFNVNEMEVEEKELVAESGDNLVEREDGESGYEDSVSEGVDTLSEVVWGFFQGFGPGGLCPTFQTLSNTFKINFVCLGPKIF